MKVLEVSEELKKISLSIKEVKPIDPVREEEEIETKADPKEVVPTEHVETMSNTIADAMKDIDLDVK